MRKSIALAIVALLLIVSGAVALAYWGEGSRQTPVYLTATNQQTQLAMASLSGCHNSYCNDVERVIPVTISASIAQWALISLNATDIEWRVLKPGDYYIDGIQATLQSNGDLYVDYEGFADLVNEDGDVLETYYALVAPGAWIEAAALNEDDDLVEENTSHQPVTFNLYNRIVVGGCDSACEYKDPNGATITVTLQEQKEWLLPR